MLQEKPISQSRILDSQGKQVKQSKEQLNFDTISSNKNLTKLMQFQELFINLVHRQIYGTKNNQQVPHSNDNIIKFQINHVAQHNQYFNITIKELSQQLIYNKKHYDPILREYFVKMISSSYMPLFRVNRYELTKLSLFGFDIYIDPLRAILQIINRIDHQKVILIQQFDQSLITSYKQNESCWTALEHGWQNYQFFQHLWQISFHVYLLKQYLSLAGTSLFKKDKQIIFTGCSGLFKDIVPWLCQNKLINLLKQFASLNNILYQFHASHNYFQFYSLIPPLDDFLIVFECTRQLQNKCKATNILTPLLFGILRNYQAFSKFIESIQNIKWVRLLNVLLSGLILNFKVRILQYSQLLDLTCKIIQKLAILGKLNFNIISSNISLDWKQARQFFISAFKSGYNPGQIQTWHPLQQASIQPQLRQKLINSLFLLDEPCQVQYLKGIQKIQIITKLDKQIINLSDGNQTLLTISSGWKIFKISIQKTEDKKIGFQKKKNEAELVYSLIRSINMVQYLQNVNQQILYFLLSSMNYFFEQKQMLNSLMKKRISNICDKINQMIMIVNRKQISISTLKQSIITFHTNYPPNSTFPDIVPVYLHSSIPKDSIPMLLKIVAKMDQQLIEAKLKQLSTAIIHRYFYIPSTNSVIIKSFQKQYKLQSDLFLIDPKINGVLISLIEVYVKQIQNLWNLSEKVIRNILSVCQWVSIPILSLPVNKNQKLQSLLTWLLKQNQSHSLLQLIVIKAFKYLQEIEEQNLKQQTRCYLQNFYCHWIQDQIHRQINSLCQIQKNQQIDTKIIKLLSLKFKLHQIVTKQIVKQAQNQNNQQQEVNKDYSVCIWHNIIKLIIYLIRKNNTSAEFVLLAINLYTQIFYAVQSLSMQEWYNDCLNYLVLADSLQQSNTIITCVPQIKNNTINNYYYTIAQQNEQLKQQVQNCSNKVNIGLQRIKNILSQSCQLVSINQNNFKQSILQQLKKWKQQKYYKKHDSNFYNLLPPFVDTNCLIQIIKQSQNSQRCSLQLQILKLNPKNAETILNFSIATKQFNLLKSFGSLELLSNKIIQIIQIIQKNKENKQSSLLEAQTGQFLNTKSITKCKTIVNIIPDIFDNFKGCSFQVLSQISSEFDLYKLKFEWFLEYWPYIWFLAVCNNTNWRYFIQQMCEILKNKNLSSLLLQYQQFINITNSPNNQYDQSISQFFTHIQTYKSLFKKKTQYLLNLNQKDTIQQNIIRKINQIANLNVISSRCHFQDIIKKIHNFYLSTQGKPFQARNTLKLIFNTFMQINSQICQLVQGFVVFPSFSHCNSLTTSVLIDNKLQLGIFLQQNLIQPQLCKQYIPKKKGSHLKYSQVSLQTQIKNINEGNFNIQQLKKKVFNQIQGKQELFNALQKQLLSKQIIQIKDNQLSILSSNSNNLQYLSKIYILGFLFEIDHQINLSAILKAFLTRNKLQMELIKIYNSQCYHHLKLVQMSINQEEKRQIKEGQVLNDSQKTYFTYQNVELIQNGANIQVNKLNKNLYLDLIIKKVLGQQFLKANEMFAMGFLNKKYMQSQTK